MDYGFVSVVFALILMVGIRSIWGAITWKINDYKGYADNGFWISVPLPRKSSKRRNNSF